MAKASTGVSWKPVGHKKVTSIGKSTQTRVNSKSGRKQHKKYRGQGK